LTPSSQCKAAGLASLKELIDTSGIAKSTLIDWHRNDQRKFKLAICAVLYMKKDKEGKWHRYNYE